MIEVPADCFYYELKLTKNPDIERFEYGFRFTVVPMYDKHKIAEILQENEEDVKKCREVLQNEKIHWTDAMNCDFVRFIQKIAVLHSYSPMTMTAADLLELMTKKENNEEPENNMNTEATVELPDPLLYPSLAGVSAYLLQHRFALICTLNQRLNVLLQNTEMDLVDEWWSLAYKLKQLRSLIFTSTKLDFLRIPNPYEYRSQVPVQVTIDRRLAQDSSKYPLSVLISL